MGEAEEGETGAKAEGAGGSQGEGAGGTGKTGEGAGNDYQPLSLFYDHPSEPSVDRVCLTSFCKMRSSLESRRKRRGFWKEMKKSSHELLRRSLKVKIHWTNT